MNPRPLWHRLILAGMFMAALVLSAFGDSVPPCVRSGLGYLPTPSPCRVEITDPRTGKPDALVLRFLVAEPKLLRPGKWPLQDFGLDQRRKARGGLKCPTK